MVGLMSGTSMDGLDICVSDIDFGEDSVAFLAIDSACIQFPSDLKMNIRQVLEGTTEEVTKTHYSLGRFYAESTSDFLTSAGIGEIDAVAVHGQTVHHISGEATLQIGEPSFLAEVLNKPVISDFRARDISVGGTGAPLMPIVDKWLFQKEDATVLCLNLGGVANITALPARSSGEDIIGFDTGPGMALLDEAMMLCAQQPFDEHGSLAAEGTADESLVEEWLNDKFIMQEPPKSTGRDYFGKEWLRLNVAGIADWKLNDLLATLSLFTARSVVLNCRRFSTLEKTLNVIVSGGGVHHKTVMKLLTQQFSPVEVTSSVHFNVDPDVKEALGFAILGAAYLKSVPGNLPSVTGASHPVVLGKLTL